MAVSLEDRIAELRREPWDHDRLDVEALLKAAGFARKAFPEIATDVWQHDGWRMRVTLDTRRRSLPVPYLQDILAEIQAHLERERPNG